MKPIIAELRRSAIEDEIPWTGVADNAFAELFRWRQDIGDEALLADAEQSHLRTFMLLVACAIEDEL